MRKTDASQTISIMANIGVIVGIVFLVLELNQTNEMVRAQTRASVTQATLENIAMYRDARVMSAFQRARNGGSLSADDLYILDNSSNATLRMWENNYYQYRAGLFDESEFDAELTVWRQLLQNEPEFERHWRSSRLNYSAPFRQIVDGIVDEQP